MHKDWAPGAVPGAGEAALGEKYRKGCHILAFEEASYGQRMTCGVVDVVDVVVDVVDDDLASKVEED